MDASEFENKNKKELEEMFYSPDEYLSTNALLYAVFNINDFKWVQDICIKLINSQSKTMCLLAITCLGHIARIYGKIDGNVIYTLKKLSKGKGEKAGIAEQALGDIKMFARK